MTNSNLVTVFNGTIQYTQIQLCNARELHQYLEIKTRFDDWIKNRIADYGFIQDEDYIIVTERTNGRPRKDYHITLDMGKELGMVERNEKGRQIRQYFIACEKKQYQSQLTLPEPEKTYTIKFTECELEDMAWLWFIALRAEETFKTLHPALKSMGSHYVATVRDQAYEYNRTLQKCHKIINKLTANFDYDPKSNWRVLKYIKSYDPKAKGFQIDIF